MVSDSHGYCVGDDGSVYSRVANVYLPGKGRVATPVLGSEWRRLAAAPNGDGYPCVQLSGVGGKKDVNSTVHKLVLLAFKGPPKKGQECRHLNGVRNDNRVGNLEWGTRLENMQDRGTHGTHVKGAKKENAKLTADDVRMVFGLKEMGLSNREIASRFGCDRSVISRVLTGRRYKAESEAVRKAKANA